MHLVDGGTIADLFPTEGQYTDEAGAARAPGLHVSDVVRDLCSQLDPGRYPTLVRTAIEEESVPPPRKTNPRWELGMAFEEQLGDRMADRHSRLYAPHKFRPGEVTVDGITGTPDLIDPDARIWLPHESRFVEGMAVEEWKATWLTSRHDINGGKFQYWIWQGKSYCAMHGIPTLRIRALFVMGDYLFGKSPEPGPHFRTFEETYSDRELQEHWQMITQHAARMRARGVAA